MKITWQTMSWDLSSYFRRQSYFSSDVFHKLCFINNSPEAIHVKMTLNWWSRPLSGVLTLKTVHIRSTQPVISSRAAVKTRLRRIAWNATASQAKWRNTDAVSTIKACLANTKTWQGLLQTDCRLLFIQTTWTQSFPRLGQRPLVSWRWTYLKTMFMSPVTLFNFSKITDGVNMADRTLGFIRGSSERMKKVPTFEPNLTLAQTPHFSD